MDNSIQIKNEIQQLTLLNEFITQVIIENCIDPTIGIHLKLAIEEVVVNSIFYAYPEESGRDIFIRLNCEPEKLTVIITDYGIAFNPTDEKAPNITLPLEQRPVGGLGIFLTKKLMTTVAYHRDNDKNVLTLIKKLN
ncbi:MAG: ATP-binding protein [Dysgonamonadaceae bacterium]|jgi:anti-sigma regulatory factor (Ser/Thr protein kinase)|nr:ATP-binding protein [Dysgonamonadaceae bacterium]